MSIKTNVLALFMTLVLLVSSSLLYLHYKSAISNAKEWIKQSSALINDKIALHLQETSDLSRAILKAKANFKDLLEPITLHYQHPSMDALMTLLMLQEDMRAIYFVQENGDFYEVMRLNRLVTLQQNIKVPKEARWALLVAKKEQAIIYFLNQERVLIGQSRYENFVDMRRRLWYKEAKSSDDVVITSPYNFNSTKRLGITFAYAKEGVVLGCDYSLNALQSLLQESSIDAVDELFFLDEKGEKFVSSKKLNVTVNNSMIQKLFRAKTFNTLVAFRSHGRGYLVGIYRSKSIHIYSGIVIDVTTLYAPYKAQLLSTVYIGLILLIVALIIVYIATHFLVSPIGRLIQENTKVAKREFGEVRAVKTHITEFKALSYSLVSMAEDIQSYAKSQEALLESIVKLIAEAIDAKSTYTGGHCERVPKVATLLLEALNASDEKCFQGHKITSDDELRAFEIGAWLHDCGKVTTPEHVVDKSVKLETIYNRIHEIRTRFEVILRDRKIALLEAQLPSEKLRKVDDALEDVLRELREQFAFVATCNIGGEYLDESKVAKLHTIAKLKWSCYFDKTLGLGPQEHERMAINSVSLPTQESLLQDAPWHIIVRENFDEEAFRAEGFTQEVPQYLYNYGELYNLSISKGTLTPEERFKINEHIIMTIKMLEKIPFPKALKNVAYYAGTHHEKLDGTGYPRSLKSEELSMGARIMVLADIFEALSASDRPYNRPKKLSEVIEIMHYMVKDSHIDANLFRLFLESGVYLSYAKNYLKTEQLDVVDISRYCCADTNEA